ncbi:hypothetical protein SRHO_G00133520 [Serrasalmus rhombeus]
MAVWASAGRLGIRGCNAGAADKAEAAVVVVWPAGQGLAMLSVDRFWAGISHPPPMPPGWKMNISSESIQVNGWAAEERSFCVTGNLGNICLLSSVRSPFRTAAAERTKSLRIDHTLLFPGF